MRIRRGPVLNWWSGWALSPCKHGRSADPPGTHQHRPQALLAGPHPRRLMPFRGLDRRMPFHTFEQQLYR